MSYFKRFTDFCAGFAVFGALLHIVRNFITFKKNEDISTLEKVKDFFDRGNSDDYRAYAIIAIALTASLFIGILLKKYPFVALSASAIPMVLIIDMFVAERIEERPMFYVALAAIHVVGAIFECISRDKEHSFKKLNCTFVAGLVTTFAGGALSLFTAYRLSEMKSLYKTADLETFDITELTSFDAELFNLIKDASGKDVDATQLIILAVMFIVVLVVAMFIGEIFFIDLAFSAIPLGTIAYCYSTNVFLPQADMLITVALISTAVFFAATLFGTRLEKKKIEPVSAPEITNETVEQTKESTEA